MAADADMTAPPHGVRTPRPAQPPEASDPLDEMSATIARGERRDR